MTYGACSTQTCRVSCSTTRHGGKRRAAQVVVVVHTSQQAATQWVRRAGAVAAEGQALPACLPAAEGLRQHSHGWLLGVGRRRALQTLGLVLGSKGLWGAHRLHVWADLGTVTVHQQAPPPGSLPRVRSCTHTRQEWGMSAALEGCGCCVQVWRQSPMSPPQPGCVAAATRVGTRRSSVVTPPAWRTQQPQCCC